MSSGTPNADMPMLWIRATCPCSNQRLPLTREIATRDFNVHATPTLPNAEHRNPDMMGSCATYPPNDRRPLSIRGIALRDLSRCRTLTSSNPECRNPEVRGTLILYACGRGYLSRNSSSIGWSSGFRRTSRGSPTVDSLSPEEVSSAPPSFCVASTGVDFRSEQKNYLS